jgi:putative nucleotidyltransferase with HDIG domain
MAARPFRTLLRNQIVVPLLVVSMSVALLAIFAGVSGVSGIVDSWYEGDAYQAAAGVRSELDDVAVALAADAYAVADDPTLVTALGSGDVAGADRRIGELLHGTGVTALVVLGSDGAVLARTGSAPVAGGERPLQALPTGSWMSGAGFTTFLTLGGHDTIAGLRNGQARGKPYTVLAVQDLDPEFLHTSLGGAVSAVAVSVPDGDITARFVDPRVHGGSGELLSEDAYRDLESRIATSSDAMRQSIRQPGATARFTSAGEPYTVRSERISFATGGVEADGTGRRPASDPTGAARIFTIAVSNRAASEAGRTTTVLISFWSLVAAIVLTLFGAVLARRVSDPLAALSASARMVADGDFTARVEVDGAREVVELGDAFNAMTGSLRERTESLTKKVLELATLYEMSRALGSTLDLDVLLDSVLDSALRIFDVDSGYVMLRDRESGRLELRTWRGGGVSRPDEHAIRSSMSDWVMLQGRPLIFNPPADGAIGQQVDAVTGAIAALCVPLVSSEGVIGAIAVGTHDREHRFSADDVRLLSTIANHVTIAVGNIELFSSLQDAYLATVRSLAAAVDAKDPYTRGHSDRVAAYARAIAERLGLAHEQCTALEMAAYLHDIGKIGIGEEILRKRGALSDEERAVMRHHPLIGASILRPVAFPWPIAPVVRHHHERFDGTGYPAGLSGEEIPMLARILTVADAYEAMTSDRPYRAGRTAQQAIDELKRCASLQFDPRAVDALIEELEAVSDTSSARSLDAFDPIGAVEPEEARAIFVAVADGMLLSYRRLGGPRLASNLETEMNEWLTGQSLPFALDGGHMTGEWSRAAGAPVQLESMRRVVEHLAGLMGATAGTSLVDHFYDDAVEGLSERMRRLAAVLSLYATP